MINKKFNESDCYNLLYEIYWDIGDLEKSLFYINCSLELDSKYINLINKGLILYELNDFENLIHTIF